MADVAYRFKAELEIAKQRTVNVGLLRVCHVRKYVRVEQPSLAHHVHGDAFYTKVKDLVEQGSPTLVLKVGQVLLAVISGKLLLSQPNGGPVPGR